MTLEGREGGREGREREYVKEGRKGGEGREERRNGKECGERGREGGREGGRGRTYLSVVGVGEADGDGAFEAEHPQGRRVGKVLQYREMSRQVIP